MKYYLKFIVVIYFIISSIYGLYVNESYVFIHEKSEFYYLYKAIVIVLEILIAYFIYNENYIRKGVCLGISFLMPSLIVSVLNIFYLSKINCQIGFLSGDPLLILVQNIILLVAFIILLFDR